MSTNQILSIWASDVIQSQYTFTDIFTGSLLAPMKIIFLDPAIFFANAYILLIYGIYYSLFEVFSIAYQQIYSYNLEEMGCWLLLLVMLYFCGLQYRYCQDICSTNQQRKKGEN